MVMPMPLIMWIITNLNTNNFVRKV